MSKIIELDKYRKNKLRKKRYYAPIQGPVWFYELNEGIKQLACKDAHIIIQNVKECLFREYHEFLQSNGFDKRKYSMDQYIIRHLNIKEPFSIAHGIEFSRGHHLKVISENDWNNISDIIIRISLMIHYHLCNREIEPIELVDQYIWDSIQIDILK